MPSGKKRKRHKVATHKRKKGVELTAHKKKRLILNHSSLISLIST